MPDNPGAKFQAVLKELSISRVVCVDDIYESRIDRETILAWAGATSNSKAAAGILKALEVELEWPSETAAAELRGLLEKDEVLSRKLQEKIDYNILKSAKSVPLSEEETQLITDRSVLSRLDELMSGFPRFERLSPAQWTEQKSNILASMGKIRTLFIFDENLGAGVLRGTEFIEQIARSECGAQACFCLLSYTIESGTEHQCTRDLQNRDITATTISKRDLSPESGIEYLRTRLRAAVLWAEAKELRTICSSAMETAWSDARDRVQRLSALEFDEAVFRSSYQEGVHEMDTLIRVYANAFAARLRENLRSNREALRHIDTLRSYRSDGKEPISPGSKAWKLQRDEYYDSGAYINSCMMPTETGDIYQIKTENGRAASYVLIAPPCDLMVRSNDGGRRASGATQGLLCQISNEKPDPKQVRKTFPLDYYNLHDGTRAWVYFSQAYMVDLWLLDLCSIDSKGRASRFVNDVIPELLSEAWKEKYAEQLVPKCTDIVAGWKRWENLGKGIKLNDKLHSAHEITIGDDIKVKIGVRKWKRVDVLSLGVRRLQRLSPVLQGELVRAYSDYFARPARPHSLSVGFDFMAH